MKKPRKHIRKISPAKTLYRKLWREAEEAWKDACSRRDKHRCAIHGLSGWPPFQVDHFISRRKKATFFDVRNGTTVCRADNMLKAFGDPIGITIARHVEKREGKAAVDEMLARTVVIKKWTITELEEQIKYLNGLYQEKGRK